MGHSGQENFFFFEQNYPLKEDKVGKGHFSSLNKIALLTHFSLFHFLFTISYFINMLLPIFSHFTNIKLNFFLFTNIKGKKRRRNVNEQLWNY